MYPVLITPMDLTKAPTKKVEPQQTGDVRCSRRLYLKSGNSKPITILQMEREKV
jgi:hypothetical protein